MEADDSVIDPIDHDYEDDTDDDNDDKQFHCSDYNNQKYNKDNTKEDADGYTTQERAPLKRHAERHTNVGEDDDDDDDDNSNDNGNNNDNDNAGEDKM